MPLILYSPSAGRSFRLNHVKAPHAVISQPASIGHGILQKRLFASINISMGQKHKSTMEFKTRESMNSDYDNSIEDDWGDDGGVGADDDVDSPWEGAVLYQRNPSVSHLEYCTTLERLGLGDLSTEVSKSQASLMGLRVTKSVKEFVNGTPVLISVDVTRKKRNLRLDGIIRTVITLGCNRCGGPAADCVFSNFSLVLTEEPIEEPEIINMGVIYGQNKSSANEEQDDDDEASIDLDDWLYFPPDHKTIDISKHIRDMVHLEITINAVCDPTCKGLCLRCGQNLNAGRCSCGKESTMEKSYGPLGGLKQQMQQ